MITIVDAGMGNVGSIANMLKRVGAPSLVSGDAAVIARAQKLILPGVGAFDNGMRKIKDLGLLETLHAKVLAERVPVLGICLGMQLFTQKSEEGTSPGLGWLDAETTRFRQDGRSSLKVPHMGWNSIMLSRPSPLLAGLEDARFYFVHSYHVCCRHPADVAATARHGYDFTAAVFRGNIVGTQFHPEKSHKFGMRLLRNFVEM